MQGLVASEPRTDRCQLKTRRCHAFIALCRCRAALLRGFSSAVAGSLW
jgi:hypothetical protein